MVVVLAMTKVSPSDMLDLKERSLCEALSAVGLRELPKKYDVQSAEIWIEAIALVKKADLTQTYALAKRRGDGYVSYTKDFGRMSPIVGLVSVFPYMYLDKERFFHYESREEKLRAVSIRFGAMKGTEAREWDDDKLDAFLIDAGIEAQKKSGDVDIHNNALEEGEHLEAVPEETPIIAEEAVKKDSTLEIIETQEGTEVMREIASAKPRRGRKPTGRRTTKKK